MFRGLYATTGDIFRQAFGFEFGDSVLSSNRMQTLTSLVCPPNQADDTLNLSDLVNLTDFMGISDACSLFEIDSLKHCDSYVRHENAQNYEFEFR